MPTLTQIDPIAKTLGNILAGEPVTHGALTMIPILAPLLAEPAWLTLAEAGERARITEVSEAGSVPNLQVTNTADQPILLLDGEELVGAKQNRILNMTVLVAAGDAALFASLRTQKAAWVTRSVRAGRGHMADQGGIWDGVAARVAAFRVASPTGAMRDFYDKFETDLGAARQALAPRPGQIGALLIARYAIPIVFGRRPRPAESADINAATASTVDLAEMPFLLTAAHVMDAALARLCEPHSHLVLGPGEVRLGPDAVWLDQERDLATARLTPNQRDVLEADGLHIIRPPARDRLNWGADGRETEQERCHTSRGRRRSLGTPRHVEANRHQRQAGIS